MKNLNILKAITLFSAVIFLQVFSASDVEAQSVCVLNSSDEIVTDDKGYVDCYSSIGTQKYTIQYIGLCSAAPSIANYQNECQSVFNETAGKSIDFVKGNFQNLLDGSISLTEGVYTHAVVRIDSLIKLKSSYKFDKQMLGGAGGVGKSCWTTSGEYNDVIDITGFTSLSQLATQCGSTPNAEFTNLEYAVFSGAGFTNTITGRTSPSGPYTMYTASGINELSNATLGNFNGKHLIGIQEFNAPVKISPASASINLGFKMDGMFHVKTNWQTKGADQGANGNAPGGSPKLPVECTQHQNPGNACFKYVIPSGFEFSVSVE
jgi:hypothetical protein